MKNSRKYLKTREDKNNHIYPKRGKKIPIFLGVVFLIGAQELTADVPQPIFISTFGSGTQLNNPRGIAINPTSGNIYVIDAGNNRGVIFDSLGNFVQGGIFGSGVLANPDGISILDSNQRAYIAGGNGYQEWDISSTPPVYVQSVLNSSLNTQDAFAQDGQNIYLTNNSANPNVVVSDGSTVGPVGFGGGQLVAPMGVAVGQGADSHYVHVVDSGTNNVVVFAPSPDFSFVANYTGSVAVLNAPIGIGLQNTTHHAYVTDSSNQIFIFDTSPLNQATPSAPTLLGQFNISNDAGHSGAAYIAVQETTGKIYFTDASNRGQIWFSPTEWTKPGTSTLNQLPLNQTLSLKPDYNLSVQEDTNLLAGADLSLAGGTFASGSLSMTGGTIRDTANTTLNVPLTLTTGTFNSGQGNVFTFAGNITGGGATLNIAGPGTTILSGNKSFTGNTNVKDNSTLILRGDLRNSAVVVASGATLRGSGHLYSLDSAGIVSPGNSSDTVGTLTIANDYTMQPTNIHQVKISADGTSSDKVIVGGNTQVDGTLKVTSLGDNLQNIQGKTYTILQTADQSTGQVKGTFSNVLTTTDRLKYTVQYLSNMVNIVINAAQNFADAFSPTDTSNAAKTAQYFDTLTPTPGSTLADFSNKADNLLATGDVADVKKVFEQVSPSNVASLAAQASAAAVTGVVANQVQAVVDSGAIKETKGSCPASFQAFNRLAESYRFHRLNIYKAARIHAQKRNFPALGFAEASSIETRSLPLTERFTIGKTNLWVQNYAQVQWVKGSTNVPGVKSEAYGGAVGGDYEVLKNTSIGLFGGGSYNPYHLKSNRGKGKVNSYNGGIYAVHLTDMGLYVDGQFMGSGNRYHNTKKVNVRTIQLKAAERHKGYQLSARLEIGQIIPVSDVIVIQPYANLGYLFGHEQGTREKGAQSLNFVTKSVNNRFLKGEIGFVTYRTFFMGEDLIRPQLSLSCVNTRHVGPKTKMRTGLVAQPQTLILSGDNRKFTEFVPAFSLTAQFKNGLYMIGNVNGNVGKNLNALGGIFTLGYNF